MSTPANIINMVGVSDAAEQAKLFADLRSQHQGRGAYYDKTLGVVVIGFDAAQKILALQGKDKQVQSSVYRPENFDGPQGRLMALVANMMISVDGDIHRDERKSVLPSFGRRHIMDEMAVPIATIASELLDAQRDKGQMDLAQDFAGVFPVRVIMELLGIPKKHFPQLKRLSDVIAPAATNPLTVSSEAAKQGDEALEELREFYNDQFVTNLSGGSSENKFGQAMQRLMTVPGLNEEQKFSNFVLLFIAGHETTSRVISGTMTALLSDPAKLDRVKDDPQLVGSVVSEGLRWCSPFQAIFRRATTELDLGDGVVLKKGQSRAALILAAANRDPAYFEDPDEFKVDRYDPRFSVPPEEGLAFGMGAHRCVGAGLARVELAMAILLLTQMPGLRLAGQAPVSWESSLTFRGPKSVPVTYEPHVVSNLPAQAAAQDLAVASMQPVLRGHGLAV